MRLTLPTLALALTLSTAASGVTIDSGDGTGNTTAPAPSATCSWCTDPGWNNIGTIGSLTGVYLGGKFVLTANHVGVGDIVLGGITYRSVPGTAVWLTNGDGTHAELLMFEIYPEPPLPALPIASASPLNKNVIMAGHGLDRGPATSWNVPPPGLCYSPPQPETTLNGYQWGSGPSMRWGTNTIAGSTSVSLPSGTTTMSLYTIFCPIDSSKSPTCDHIGSAYEAQAAPGDSGGATFAANGSQWELAGILFAIESCTQSQPSDALYTNFTFTADLSAYRSQILNAMAMPEPSRGLWPGAAFVAILARRQRPRLRER